MMSRRLISETWEIASYMSSLLHQHALRGIRWSFMHVVYTVDIKLQCTTFSICDGPSEL